MKITDEIYSKAVKMFLDNISIRKISKELQIDRKLLALKLKNDGYNVSRFISEQQLNKAIYLYNNGYSINGISKILNIERHTLANKLGDNNIRHINRKYDKSIISNVIFLKNNYLLSASEISYILGCSENLVYKILRDIKYNVEYSDWKKYNDNLLFFDIQSEKEAYWLGFLYADGYINKQQTELEVILQRRDKKHLENLHNFIGYGTLKDICVNGYPSVKYTMSNSYIVRNLVENRCTNNKSLNIIFPNDIIQNDLIRHFIRGYFDGDGSITYINNNKGMVFSICCASKEMIEQLYDCLIKQTNINRNKIKIDNRHNNPLYSISNSAKKDIISIFHYLYDEATIYLERKYNKFHSLYVL